MGLEQTVTVPAGAALSWASITDRLSAHGFAAPLRMIDGLPAFPDEQPPDDWRELRVGTPAGMVTLRRAPAGVGVVVWGNAGPELEAAANALLWAVAAVGGGLVETPTGPQDADTYARTAALPGRAG
jgi:hypothetical protein